MIYDTRIDLMRLPRTVGTINQAQNLIPVHWAYCAVLEVYASSYYKAMMAGSLIDKLVELPGVPPVVVGDFADLQGSLYRIDRVEDRWDDNSLPVYRLTLQKEDGHYDYARPAAVT